jgi:hypothetical protein
VKPHPLSDRIAEFAPKLAKLPNAIRLELESLFSEIKSHFEQFSKSRSKGGRAASGSSGRPRSEPPEEAKPYLSRIADGSLSAYAASIELRAKYPKSDHKFSSATLKKWAESHKNTATK